MSSTWTLRVRKADLSRDAVVQDWSSATLVERWNLPDTLQVAGRMDSLWPLYQSAPGIDDFGRGVTLNDDSGRRFSGLIAEIDEQPVDGTVALTFESDLIRLWERVVYPTPALDIQHQTTDVGDVRSGASETVLLDYIRVNAGASAFTTRIDAQLSVPATLGRGPVLTAYTSRLDVLGQLVQAIAEPASLRVRVLQVTTGLAVLVENAPDLSATARYGTPGWGGPGLIGPGASIKIAKPAVTAAEVAGAGAGTAKVFRERRDSDAEARWGGRRIEAVVDQRQTSVLAELDKAGDDALAQGSSPVQITAPILDSTTPGTRLATDVPVGALVGLNLGRRFLKARLRELTTTAAGSSPISVTGLVGSSDAGLTVDQKELIAMRQSMRKVVAS